MKYRYYYGQRGEERSKCLVEIVDGTVEKPLVIMTEDGELYKRIELRDDQSGQRGQCNMCIFSNAKVPHHGKCPPIHDCGKGRPIVARVFHDNERDAGTILRPGNTTHHIRWDRYIPADPVEKIDIVNVEI